MKKKAYQSHIANILSLLRMALTPLCIWLLLKGADYVFLSGVICMVAGITDFYDGYFARRYGVVSKSGTFLDPLADKILVLGMFFSFAYLGLVPFWVVIAITLRDVVVTGLRLLFNGEEVRFHTSYLAKCKTTLQLVSLCMTFLVLIRYWHTGVVPPYDDADFLYAQQMIINPLMYITLAATWLSAFHYFKQAFSIGSEKKSHR